MRGFCCLAVFFVRSTYLTFVVVSLLYAEIGFVKVEYQAEMSNDGILKDFLC